MQYSNVVGGYSRSINSHKRERLNRWLDRKVYRPLMWIGTANTLTWGFVAYEVAAFMTLVFFAVMVFVFLVAFVRVA